MSDHCIDCAPEFIECWNDGSKCRKRPNSLAQAPGSALPDIGLDPLKHRDHVDGSIEATRERLGKAVALQQQGVPDQTMLAWRIDVSRLLDELTVMMARWRTHPNNPQNIELNNPKGLVK